MSQGIYFQLQLSFYNRFMLRLYQMASALEVAPVTTVILTVLIYTFLNNNKQYEAW